MPGKTTSAEVAERIQRGQVNRVEDATSRSLEDIIRANVFTRFNAILGSLGLVGLAFNDSIVVLSGIRSNPAARAGDPAAIAAQVTNNARHLISTTLTTMGSFLPLLLLIGGDFWPPLAIVLAGGVIGSTLLAFFFVPAAYRLLLCSKRDFLPTAT